MEQSRRVLIVEDEIGLRHWLASYLETRGLAVVQAGSLAEAELLLDREEFDVVVLDVGLPDGDGLTLLERSPAERSLVITANPDAAHFERYGVVHHLTKPLELREFAREVRTLSNP